MLLGIYTAVQYMCSYTLSSPHYTAQPPVVKVGFTEDNYVFTEGDGIVQVCATILTPLEQIIVGFRIIFSISTIEGTALSKLV